MVPQPSSADAPGSVFPVRALCVTAPEPESIPRFNRFIETELAPRGINTLILRIDFHYQFKTHPELIDSHALSLNQVQLLVKTCKNSKIRLIPQVNLLGHQSWQENLGKLLAVYPDFDETPSIQLPTKYQWPNKEGLYCKSYCPLHPKVHGVVFACVDEICDAFEADAFHAGLDEVFFIGHSKCHRCAGKDRSKLFADEVTRIHQHLAKSNRELWIWGDRLIDGKATGIGLWEGSTNDTFRAIDKIPRDVVICDWHYERPNKTPVLFASKGFNVITATWNRPEIAMRQAVDMARFRLDASWVMKVRYKGMMQTVWGSAERFMDQMALIKEQGSPPPDDVRTSSADCFVKLMTKMDQIESDDQYHAKE